MKINLKIVIRVPILLALLVFPSLGVASEFKAHLQKEGGDFQYLQTPEDMKRLGLFSAMYAMAGKREKPAGEIPQCLHFIWLGPKPFPATSVPNLKGWIDRHPGWKVKFWTDLSQSAPDDRMEVRMFDQFPLADLKDVYYRSDNFGERSHILRYAILINEGGVYIDHDVVCVTPIDSLQLSYDFFCGMEPLGRTVLSSSVNPSSHFIGSTAQHPILKAAKKWLISEWDRLESNYPGTDPSSVYNRVQRRAFRALSVGIKEAYARAGRKDVVFPPDYLSLNSAKNALFATHLHLGSWYRKQADPEGKAQRLLNDVRREFNWTYGLSIGLTAANIALCIYLLAGIFKRNKRRAA